MKRIRRSGTEWGNLAMPQKQRSAARPFNSGVPDRAPLALVTGGGSGIGRGIALALARRGYTLALVGRTEARLVAAADEARALGAQAIALSADLAEPAARDTVLDRVAAALRPPAIIVHAAGMLAGGDLMELDSDRIERVIAVNLAAPVALTRAALPGIVGQRGAILFVASLTADVPMPAASIYSATKAGIVAFGEALRHEVGPRGVRVLIARPPGTATAMTRGMARAAGFPSYPLASPEEVGEAIVAALCAGRREWTGSKSDCALTLVHRIAPRLTRPLIRANRHRLRRIFTAPGRQDERT